MFYYQSNLSCVDDNVHGAVEGEEYMVPPGESVHPGGPVLDLAMVVHLKNSLRKEKRNVSCDLPCLVQIAGHSCSVTNHEHHHNC